jgi:Dyp-type peroxidase family
VSEPVLDLRNIQGNVVAGFNKDFQTLIFLEILEPPLFRDWLKEAVPFVASAGEVLAFNRLFKEIRSRRGDSRTLKSTWMNLAFSRQGIEKLLPQSVVAELADEAFQKGLCERSPLLGDPAEGEGSPQTWAVGGPKNEADVILIFAADDAGDLRAEVERIERSLYTGIGPAGGPMRCVARVIHKDFGAVLPPPLTGHEHFGFLDGVSQPGLRGRASDDPHDVLTLRQNPRDPDQGKPGQDLLWPGEFVFGYSGQDPADAEKEGPKPCAPEWAKDGSYLVFRRLRQDVPGFHAFLNETAARLKIDPLLMGAKVVGRFPSGAPIMRTQQECPALGANECANNDFEFSSEPEEEEHESPEKIAECQCKVLAPPPPDDLGNVCPHAAHIRKVYPRNDRNRFPGETGEATTQKHRLLRRGIPFGPPYPAAPPPDYRDSERGLLFLAYQTSIVGQFEHVQRVFANNVEDLETGKPRAGHDLIIGQNGGKERTFVLRLDGQICTIRTDRQWVLPTGGGYFFAPSICVLARIAANGLR